MAKDLKNEHEDLSLKALFLYYLLLLSLLYCCFPCSFLHTRAMRVLGRDISNTLTEPNTEEAAGSCSALTSACTGSQRAA